MLPLHIDAEMLIDSCQTWVSRNQVEEKQQLTQILIWMVLGPRYRKDYKFH